MGGGGGGGGPLCTGQCHLLGLAGVLAAVGAEDHAVELRDAAAVEAVPDAHVGVALQERPLQGHWGVRGTPRGMGVPKGSLGVSKGVLGVPQRVLGVPEGS